MCNFFQFLGESRIFNQNETYQRALLHWNRAASQGWLTFIEHLPLGYISLLVELILKVGRY